MLLVRYNRCWDIGHLTGVTESSVNDLEKEVNNDVINFMDNTNLMFFLLIIGGNFRKSIVHCHKLFSFGKTAKIFTENMILTITVSSLKKHKTV